MTKRESRLSVEMALDQVQDKCNDVRRLNDELDYARRERNRVLKEALRFVPMSQLMKTSALSRDMLYRIKNSPDD